MVDAFLCASHDDKGTFHHAMNSLRERVSAKEQETIFLPHDEQAKSFAKSKLSYKDVCLHAVKTYNELRNNNMWEPGKLPRDNAAPAANLTKAQILNLIESVRNNSTGSSNFNNNRDGKSTRSCYNCGDPDHLAKDCPKPKLTPDQAKAKRHQSMTKWKLTAPQSGEPSSKTVNGRTFKWCQKCGNWTTTHDTDSHTGNGPSINKTKDAQTNLTAWEPSAWMVEVINKPTTHHDYLTPLLFGYITLTAFLLILNLTSAYPNPYVTFTYESTRDFLFATFQSFSTMLISHISSCLAPMLWFSIGYLTCYLHRINPPKFNAILDANTDDDNWNIMQPQKSPKLKHKSAKDYNLHRSYPLRLRQNNRFNTRASTPTINARRALDFTDKCLSFNCHCDHPHLHSAPATKSKRGNKAKRGLNKSFCLQRSSTPAIYKPTGISNKNSLPNLNYTTKQYRHLHTKAQQVLAVTGANLNDETKDLARVLASLSPSGFRAAIDSQECKSFPVIWDTGASVCVTPDRHDFITYTQTTDINEVKGLGGKRSPVTGQGEVIWTVHDTHGSLRQLRLNAYHIPQCKSRLISTSVLLNTYKGEHLTVDAVSLQLSGFKSDSKRNPVIAFNNSATNLPTTTAYLQKDTHGPVNAMCHNISTVHNNNLNLTEAQKELLRWHQRLGHLAFKKIQHLMRTGVLSHTDGTRQLHTAASKIAHPPKCAACLFGKQTIRSAPGTTSVAVRDRAGILTAGNLLPGAEVSIDHFISSVKGRLFQGYDKGSDDSRHVGGCIFVDHASSYIHVEFQTSLSSHETI